MHEQQLPSQRRTRYRAAGLRVVVFLALLPFACESRSAASRVRPEVHLLRVEGVINPLTVRYLVRGLEAAGRGQASLVVLQLNTPGGLETSMREMVEAILASPVPVAVFVSPPGGRAASAGMFITMAGHVAAMAPGTNIGAAHPVGIGSESGDVMQEKVVRDAAAFARSIAHTRGRNARWAERAVLESVSITASEAVEQNVIDLVATDLDQLLDRLEGRTIAVDGRQITLALAGAEQRRTAMSVPEQIAHAITDPNVAYLLFSLGMVGLIAELYNPGMLVPGITGAISLLVAFVAFGSLPLNWGAVALLVLAAALLVAELYTEGTGVAAVGAIVAFVVGSLMLYQPMTTPSPSMPDPRVSPWLVFLMTGAIVGFFAVVIRALVRAQRAPVRTGIQGLVGRTGSAVTPLQPEGTVRVDSEQWHAVSEGGDIAAGDEVQIVAVEGVTLTVKRTRLHAAPTRRAAS